MKIYPFIYLELDGEYTDRNVFLSQTFGFLLKLILKKIVTILRKCFTKMLIFYENIELRKMGRIII